MKAYNQTGESKWRGTVKKMVLDHAPADDAVDLEALTGDVINVTVASDKVLHFPPLMRWITIPVRSD